MPRLSIVIPCHNGVATVQQSLTRLTMYLTTNLATLGSCEILFVDDGSTDGSGELVEREFPETRVLHHRKRRGKGGAVRTGVLAARGEFTCFMDVDVPYSLEALDRMIDYLDRKEFDVCIGTRARALTPTLRKRSRLRRWASSVFTFFVSRIVVTGIHDTQCGFKAFRSDVARYLFEQSRIDNFAFDVEILYLAFKNDLDVKRVSVELEHDDDSSVSPLRHGLPMLWSILQLPLRFHRGAYAMRNERSS